MCKNFVAICQYLLLSKINLFKLTPNISDSRLAKLDAPDSLFAAIIISTAGLVRLNPEHSIIVRLSRPEFLHAVGQGALGIEICSAEGQTRELIQPLDHWPTMSS
jgi:hydroxymethylbilane synthase